VSKRNRPVGDRSMQYDVAAKVTVEIAKYSIVELIFGIKPRQVSLIERLPQESVSLRRSDFPLMVEAEGELINRRDIMIQSAAYEIIKNEGLQQGLKEAVESLLRVKFGVEGTKLMEKLNGDVSVEKLRTIKNAVKIAQSIQELEKMFEWVMI